MSGEFSQPGLLIVLTGPSGSGKDAVLNGLLAKHPHFSQLVTTTSRPMRHNEQPGREYNFVLRSDFERMLKDNELFEHVKYSGNYYGTTKKAIEEVLEGKNLIWRIEMSMASKIPDEFPIKFGPEKGQQLLARTLVFCLTVPQDSIRRRLVEDRSWTDHQVAERLIKDRSDWAKYGPKFSLVIPNPDGALDHTISQISEEIKAHL